MKALKPARAGRRVGGLGLRSSERSAGWRVDGAVGSSTGVMGETGERAGEVRPAASRSSAEFQELREELERLLFFLRREAFREENMLGEPGVERVIPGKGERDRSSGSLLTNSVSDAWPLYKPASLFTL